MDRATALKRINSLRRQMEKMRDEWGELERELRNETLAENIQIRQFFRLPGGQCVYMRCGDYVRPRKDEIVAVNVKGTLTRFTMTKDIVRMKREDWERQWIQFHLDGQEPTL